MIVRRGVFWPLLLIVVGGALLLANLQLIPALSVRSLFTLWPLILILIGIDIALGRRYPAAALLVEAGLLLGAIALVASSPTFFYRDFFFVSGPGSAAAPGTSHVSAERGSAKSLSLRVTGGAGTITLAGGSSDLVDATSEHPDLGLRTTGTDRVDVHIDQSERGFRFGPTGPNRMDVHVASDVPASVEVNAGAGDFTVDLSAIRATDARLNMGAASLRLVLPKPSGDVAVTVSAGASSIVIEVPSDVEARVSTSGALISVRSENPRVSGSETTGYANAKDRVTVRVTAGASSVVIR